MKRQYELGEIVTFKGSKMWIKVKVVSSPVVFDKKWNCDFRVTCKGCAFNKAKMISCSGHRVEMGDCLFGGCKGGLCGPEHRTDGKYIEYHKISEGTL